MQTESPSKVFLVIRYWKTMLVYSNATILGRITIGKDATVGGNIWVTENVPAGAKIVQTKAKK